MLYACIKACKIEQPCLGWRGCPWKQKPLQCREKLSTVNTQQLSPLGSSGQPSTIGRAALCLHGQC